MKLLHITAATLNPVGGVSASLKVLIEEQNKSKNFISRLLSLGVSSKKLGSQFCDDLSKQSLEEYLESYKPDVAILHSFFYLDYIRVHKILLSKKIPYFIQPHGSFHRKALKDGRLKKYIANRTIFKSLIEKAEGYIYLCEGEKKNSVYHKPNDMIIPNGISNTEIPILKSEDIKIFYMGRYDIHEKGLNVLFDALDILDKKGISVNIDFFGNSTNPKQTEELNARIKNYKNVNARNLGPVFGDAKQTVLSLYNIMILPSRHEGLSMSVLEAWHAGIPCIVTKETNVAEMAVANHAGWQTELDAQKLSDDIIYAVRDYLENKESYIYDCINFVRSEFMLQSIVKKSLFEFENFLKLYNNR